MLCPSDIELTRAEILEVEDAILNVQKKDWVFLVETVAEMNLITGNRWQSALQEDDAIQAMDAMNQAIIEYAKQTGLYGKYIAEAKERIIEEHEDSLRRRASNE